MAEGIFLSTQMMEEEWEGLSVMESDNSDVVVVACGCAVVASQK